MNIELKPIAESKVRQLGGDVCGVLVRDDSGVMAVSEHGRCTRLDAGVMGPVEPAESSERELFEQKFPVPEGIEWSNSSQMYSAIGGVAYNVANHWNIRFEAWQAARAQGGQGADVVASVTAVGGEDFPWANIKVLHPEKLNAGDLLYTQPQPAVPEDEYGHLHRTIELLTKKLIKAESAVPEVPTEQMLDEGVTALTRGLKTFGGNYTQIVNNIWEDMAAALLSTPTTPQADGWAEPDLMWDSDSPEESCAESAYELADNCASDLPANETMVVNVACAKILPSRTMKIWIDDNDELQWEWTSQQAPAGQEGIGDE